MLVLDEADRMLDMGFAPALRRLLPALPPTRQTLLFSATLPDDVVRLSREFTCDPQRVDVSRDQAVAPTITHHVHPVDYDRKRALLVHVVTQAPASQALVFCKTKHGADRIGDLLERAAIHTGVIHGRKSQSQRTRSLADFKAGRIRVLVATDIAARGLDVAQLPLVVNFDLPLVAEDYVHRVGRTWACGSSRACGVTGHCRREAAAAPNPEVALDAARARDRAGLRRERYASADGPATRERWKHRAAQLHPQWAISPLRPRWRRALPRQETCPSSVPERRDGLTARTGGRFIFTSSEGPRHMPWPFAHTPSSTEVSAIPADEASIAKDAPLVLRAGLTTRLRHDSEKPGASVTIPGTSDPVVTGTPPAAPRSDLARTVLAVLLLGVLIVGSFWILRPFLLSLLWAITIVVATWPLLLMLQARVKRRAVAVAIMTGAMLLVFIVPVGLAIDTLAEHTDTMTRWAQMLTTSPIPAPPDWVLRIPMVGEKIAQAWSEIAAGGQQGLVARVAPYAAVAAQYLAVALSGIGLFVVQLLLTIVMAVILFVNGETARDALIRFGRRLAGNQGETVVLLAGQSIRAVALGVVVTALAQTVLAGLGLFVTGVPFAGLLTAMILILCIAQLGPIIVLVPAVIWLYWTDQPLWGSVLLVWTLVVGTMDNVLRPVLIRRGADLPLLLIFAGVIGGLIAFGIVGLFVGPVVLAIAYTLLQQWMNAADASQA